MPRALVAVLVGVLVAAGCSKGSVPVAPSPSPSPARTSRGADVSRYIPADVGGRQVQSNAQGKSLAEAIERGEGIEDAAVATVGAKPNPDDVPDMVLEAVAGPEALRGAAGTRDKLAEELGGSVTDEDDASAGGLTAHVWLIRSTQRTPPEVVFALAEDAGVVLVAIDFRGDEAAALEALAAMAEAGRG